MDSQAYIHTYTRRPDGAISKSPRAGGSREKNSKLQKLLKDLSIIRAN